MSLTEGLWEQNTAFPDLQIFVGPDEIKNTAGVATLTLNASGDLSLNIGNTQACVFEISEPSLFRTGRLATPALDQEQFGTAANQPGPSAVAGTSSPLGLPPGFPPIVGSKLATVAGSQSGATPKGIQVNSIDVIYSVTGLALALAQIGITQTKFTNNAALVVSNLLAKAANGLPVAIGAAAGSPYVINVPLPAPVMLTTPDNIVIIELDLTTGATGTARVYGLVLRCSYNFN